MNSAPTLSSITDRTVTAGIAVLITNSVTDADLPANSFTYTLEPGAPAGASIDSLTGIFSWTPSTNQAPSTNIITIRVTDNGSPPMSDTSSFTLTVNPPSTLRLTSIAVAANGEVTITWNSQAGKQYRVEYSDSLPNPSWSRLGDYSATGGSTSATNTAPGASQRYYRVLQLN
jgi:hypothetical protein